MRYYWKLVEKYHMFWYHYHTMMANQLAKNNE